MNKLMTVVAASVCAVSLSAVAAEDPKENQASAEALEEEETPIFEAGADLDFFSAYVWRNAVQNDEPVVQPCVWADLTYFEPFWLGFSIWQNYDLTRRRHSAYRRALTETDYNVHGGVTVWSSDDDEMSVDLEFGHDWYTYHTPVIDHESFDRNKNGNTREFYAKATFANPIVDLYGQFSWMYSKPYVDAKHFELGLKKEVELVESLSLGADLNFNFGDRKYLSWLYGVSSPSIEMAEDEDSGEAYLYRSFEAQEGLNGCVGGTTLKTYLTWSITDWLSIQGTVAYTGLLNDDARDGLKDFGNQGGWQGSYYRRDLFWGGLSLHTSF